MSKQFYESLISLLILNLISGATLMFSQEIQGIELPFKIEDKTYDSRILNYTEWRCLKYDLFEKTPENNRMTQAIMLFGEDKVTLSNPAPLVQAQTSDFLVDHGKVFVYQPIDLVPSDEYKFNLKYDFDYTLSAYSLGNGKICTLMTAVREIKRAKDAFPSYDLRTYIIASLTDSLMVLAPVASVVRKGSDYYSYDAIVYINCKYLQDMNVRRRYAAFNLSDEWVDGFTSKEYCDADTLKLDIESWIANNISFPENYSGAIDEGKAKFRVVFDHNGNVTGADFLYKLDKELSEHIVYELKKMPSVGQINEKENNIDMRYRKVSQSRARFTTKQIFTIVFAQADVPKVNK